MHPLRNWCNTQVIRQQDSDAHMLERKLHGVRLSTIPILADAYPRLSGTYPLRVER